jgi:hypothetical protein
MNPALKPALLGPVQYECANVDTAWAGGAFCPQTVGGTGAQDAERRRAPPNEGAMPTAGADLAAAFFLPCSESSKVPSSEHSFSLPARMLPLQCYPRHRPWRWAGRGCRGGGIGPAAWRVEKVAARQRSNSSLGFPLKRSLGTAEAVCLVRSRERSTSIVKCRISLCARPASSESELRRLQSCSYKYSTAQCSR